VPGADVFFAAHQRGVFRYLCRVVGEPEAARDLTQEVFLRVSRATMPDGGETRQRAWVFHIARNLALNHLRDRGRRGEAEPLADIAHEATQELRVALDRALGHLAAVDRDVFVLRESAGFSYAEVAAACDITVDAVRARLHRARQQLRVELGPSLVDRQRTRGLQLRQRRDDDDR
jgi:RNA polymerase sigma-70 factor (ECF subfamily)